MGVRGAWGRVCGERQTNGRGIETVRMGTGGGEAGGREVEEKGLIKKV